MTYYSNQLKQIKTNTGYAPTLVIADSEGNKTKHIDINPESAKALIGWLQAHIIPHKIEWTRLNSDVNGNPRYACHFSELLKEDEYKELGGVNAYALAVKRANSIGGRKYNTSKYGGGLVFQTYNTDSTEKHINNLIANL